MKIPDFIRRAVDKPEVVVDNDYVLLSQLRQQFEDVKRNASRISFMGHGLAKEAVLALDGIPMMAGATTAAFAPTGEDESEPIQATPSTPEGLYMFLRKLQEEIVDYEQEHGAMSQLTSIKSAVVNLISKEPVRELKPSRLIVPKSKGIILNDFGCELSLPSLPKAVLVLFLRHPEGIVLKQRASYYDELLAIYGKFYNKANEEEYVENCKRLVDLTDGSMDQKITTINSVFKKNLTLELAEQYQILGERGGVKSIQLDRSLVKLPEELDNIPLTVVK